MKKIIFLLATILILSGAVALGFGIRYISGDEAFESATTGNSGLEIDGLNLRLLEISHENILKQASFTAINTYSGRITKYAAPFDSETNLEIKRRTNEKALGQIRIDIVSSAVSLYNSELAFADANTAYDRAIEEYNEAKSDSSLSSIEVLSLEYTAKSKRIAMTLTENNLESSRRKLAMLLGEENVSVDIPMVYSDPYSLDFEKVYEKALETDIGIYRAKRESESASMKFEIAKLFFDEDDTTYVGSLAGLRNAELAYDNALLSLEASVLDGIESLMNKYDSIELEKLNNLIKLEAFNSAGEQYDAGILSKVSYDASQAAYNAAQRQLASKIYDYIIASMKFELDTGYEF
ncbi:MAG: TolC family protein [Clostridia bacterium]